MEEATADDVLTKLRCQPVTLLASGHEYLQSHIFTHKNSSIFHFKRKKSK